ncbi:MAG: hypothetical protein ACPG31_05420 [Planctomycetota bacterium]
MGPFLAVAFLQIGTFNGWAAGFEDPGPVKTEMLWVSRAGILSLLGTVVAWIAAVHLITKLNGAPPDSKEFTAVSLRQAFELCQRAMQPEMRPFGCKGRVKLAALQVEDDSSVEYVGDGIVFRLGWSAHRQQIFLEAKTDVERDDAKAWSQVHSASFEPNRVSHSQADSFALAFAAKVCDLRRQNT